MLHRLFGILLLCATASADDFRWQVTDSSFSWEVTERGGDPSSASVVTPTVAQDAPQAGSGTASETAAPEPVSNTTVCRCQGYRESVCLCLKAGVKCHCSRTVGSVWAVNEQGRATHKTGAKADPRGTSAIARSDAPAASANSYEATRRTDGRYWWTAGGTAYWVGKKPVDGDSWNISGQTWECVGGRMQLRGSVMAADIGGHWETRRVCRGSYCENVRVWVPQ